MTDRHVTGQPGEHAFTEDIGHESHAAVRARHTSPIHRDHASRFLAPVLQAVEPEVRDARSVGDARYADDAAHPVISLPCVEEWR